MKKEEKKLEDQVTISNLREALVQSEKAMNEDHDEEKAKGKYQEAMDLYSKLSTKQKDKLYPELMKTYNHLS